MGPGLQLSQRLTQSLVLAPQLQQSLALLQAPTLELKALVEPPNCSKTPCLKKSRTWIRSSVKNPPRMTRATRRRCTDFAEPPEDVKFDAATETNSGDPVDDFQAEFEKLVQMDQDWRDHFSQANTPIRSSAEDDEKRQFMFDSITAETSLAQHLIEQVRDTDLNEEEQGIAELLIGNIDDYGYLWHDHRGTRHLHQPATRKNFRSPQDHSNLRSRRRWGTRFARMSDAPA